MGARRVGAFQLYSAVLERGGFRQASKDKANWWQVAEELGILPGLAGTVSFQVKRLYEERLLAFEDSFASTVGGMFCFVYLYIPARANRIGKPNS